MSTKGKGGKKGKKGKGKDKDKMKLVDRTFYELTITDLNRKLSHLRSHLANLDESNINLTEKLRELNEDRTDVAAHLDRTLDERNNTINELEERLREIERVRETENTDSREKINELEARYKAMHDQLQSEIKLLNGKLNSLDEFRVQRDLLLAKFDVQEDDLREKDRLHEEALYHLEQKAVVEKDAIKKEVEAKLLQVSEDFTRSSEIRNAGYTRRLIRENIALQKEIDVLVLSQIKMQQQHDEQVDRHKEMREQYESLDQLKKQLIRSSQNKIHIIEKLTSNYERLKGKYVEVAKYRKLYETLVSRDVCEHFNFNDMSKKLRLLGQRIESLKLEKNQLIALQQQHEAEILRLRNVIQQIKLTLHASVQAMEEETVEEERQKQQKELPTPAVAEEMANAAALRRYQRHNLLEELMNIVSSHSDRLPETPSILSLSRSTSSIYKTGKIGFMPRKTPGLMEVFKTTARKVASVEMVAEQVAPSKFESGVYIPKARSSDKLSVIDVELGSTLYVSSSHEDLAQVEEEPVDENEEATSSEYQSSNVSKASVAPPAEPAKEEAIPLSAATEKPSRTHSGEQSEMPMSENYDEEGEDENSINLFY